MLWLRDIILWFFKYACRPLFLYYYLKKLRGLSSDVQIFLLSRLDFGTFLYHIYYISCWEELRGKTALVLLTPEKKVPRHLAELIASKTRVISLDNPLLSLCSRILGRHKFHDVIYSYLFDKLRLEFQQALYIFDACPRSEFHPFFDWRLAQESHSSPAFLKAYRRTRQAMDISQMRMLDAFQLHTQRGYARRRFCHETMRQLRKALGMNHDFVVLNVNAKNYLNSSENSRRIVNPTRYNVIIDELISQGFEVVLQGREEQPLFRVRKGLIDYARSSITSVAHDLALYSYCAFAITNKTGPESFCTVCNTPQLGLNYTELSQIIHNIKLRFWPKQFYHTQLARPLTWYEVIHSPSFFDLGRIHHDAEVIYKDMEEEELYRAVKEFIPLIGQKEELWLSYTAKQKEFKQSLHPIHIDLYDYPAVPCDGYLIGNSKY